MKIRKVLSQKGFPITFLLFTAIFVFSSTVFAASDLSVQAESCHNEQTNLNSYLLQKCSILESLDSQLKNKISELSDLLTENTNQATIDVLCNEIKAIIDEKDTTYADIQLYANYSPYFEYGISFNPENKIIKYNGIKVRFFIDNQTSDPNTFSGTLCENPNGSINIVVSRNEEGIIEELKTYNPDELPEPYQYLLTHPSYTNDSGEG